MSGRGRFGDFMLQAGIWILWIALLVPAGVVGWAIGHHGHGGKHTVTVTVAAGATPAPAINAAPAFSASDLAKDPTDDWLTNGGSLANERYSPLTQIDTSNVTQLKGV